MLLNILTTLESSKTWAGAYASVYNLYTQYSYTLADAVSNNFEYRAQLASTKKFDDDLYAREMEKSVVERAKISVQLNKAQGDLIRSRVNVCVAILAAIEPKLSDIKFQLHDYDKLCLLDKFYLENPEHPIISHLTASTDNLLIENVESVQHIFINVMEKHRELPNLPFEIGRLGSDIERIA